jgi:hypothetical protein
MHRKPSSEAEKSSTALTTVENTNGWLAVGERYLNPPVLFHSRTVRVAVRVLAGEEAGHDAQMSLAGVCGRSSPSK